MHRSLLLMPRPDSALVRLARNWIERLRPIGGFVMDVSGSEGWRVPYVFYQSLLSIGCKIVGRSGGDVYMRCGDKLVRLYLGSLFSVHKDLKNQIRELEEKEERRLAGRTSYVEIWIGPINISVCGMEPVEVIKLTQGPLIVKSSAKHKEQTIDLKEPVDLYLYKVGLVIGQQESQFWISLNPYREEERSISYIDVVYILEEGARLRYYIAVSTYDNVYELADKEVERLILESLNKKASVIDELLSQAEPLIYEPFRRLVIYALY